MIIFIVYFFYRLKVGDICIIMRNLCVKDGLANNTRVQILDISPLRIHCQTLGDHPKSIVLPRIRFNFRLPYGQSFTMTRLQFPLRRAYCMSIHKSQGQTLGRVLVDARAGFLHMVKLTWRLQESPISEISGFVSPRNNFASIDIRLMLDLFVTMANRYFLT